MKTIAQSISKNYITSESSNIIKDPKISIVIPCYNEEETIGDVINKINSLHLPNYEIIMVDDGSKDNSVEIAKKLKNTIVYRHKINKRYGKTLLDGIRKSTGSIIVTMDSDGQHDAKDIPVLIKPILENKADIVVGSRYQGRYDYNIPFTNRAGEAFIEALMRLFFQKGVKNNQGGMRAFHRKTLDIFDNIRYFDMAFTTEILLIALIKKYRIIEGSIHLHDRPVGKSRVKKIKLLFNVVECFAYYIWLLLRTRVNEMNSRRSLSLPRSNLSAIKNPITTPIIHIFIPVYNEENAICKLVCKIENVMKSNYQYRITIIDDGSFDRTVSMLREKFPSIDIRQNRKNMGKGATLKRAFNMASSNEIVVFMDGDGEHKPQDLPRLINPIINKEAHAVIGSRFLYFDDKNSKSGTYLKNQKKFSMIRKFGNSSLSIITYLFYHQFISDTQCGFRAFRPNILKNINIESQGFQFEIELTIKTIKQGYKIKEVPIDCGLSSRESHMKMIKDTIKILFVIIFLRMPENLRNFLNSSFESYWKK